jgi:hypothetical protein
MYEKSTVYILGTARLGKTDPILSTYDIFFIGLIIDKNTDMIIDTTCNTVKEKTAEFINSIISGHNIHDDIEHEIRERYFGMAQRALMAAVKDARNKYQMILEGNEIL